MKNSARIDYIDCLKPYYSSLKDVSLDYINQVYLCRSQKKAINFDEFKSDYSRMHSLNYCSSVDALIQYEKDREKAILVEFKNEKIDTDTIKSIKNKIKDSYLILLDIMNLNFNEAKQHLDFILVESKKKNAGKKKNFNLIKNRIFSNAKKHCVNYNLQTFEGYMFKNVYTMNEEEFEDFVRKNI